MRKQSITSLQATCIIAGYSIGMAVLSLPYLSVQIGIIPTIVILLASFIFNYFFALMVADMSIKLNGSNNIIEALKKYLFKGKNQDLLVNIFFISVFIMLTINLTGYIVAASEMITNYTGINIFITKGIFYLLAVIVVFFGIRVVGISEIFAIGIITLVLLAMAIVSFNNVHHSLVFIPNNPAIMFPFFGLSMLAFSNFFAIPQIVKGLACDKIKIKKSLFGGMIINLIFILCIIICVLIASETVTEVAIVGWINSVGAWSGIIGALFSVIAMLSTYWSISLALTDTIQDFLKIKRALSWIIATLPSISISLLIDSGFVSIVRISGGLVAILTGIIAIPAYINSEKDSPSVLIRKNNTTIAYITLFAFVMMAVCCLISI